MWPDIAHILSFLLLNATFRNDGESDLKKLHSEISDLHIFLKTYERYVRVDDCESLHGIGLMNFLKTVEAGNNVVTFLLISFPPSFSSFSRDFNRQHSRPVMSYDDIQPVANEYIRYKVIQISL